MGWDGQRKDRFTLALKSLGHQGGYGTCDVHTSVVCAYAHICPRICRCAYMGRSEVDVGCLQLLSNFFCFSELLT